MAMFTLIAHLFESLYTRPLHSAKKMPVTQRVMLFVRQLSTSDLHKIACHAQSQTKERGPQLSGFYRGERFVIQEKKTYAFK